MKFKQRLTAIKLRKAGRSYKEINFKIDVSKGTLSRWLAGLKLTKKQQKRLEKKIQKNRFEIAKRKRMNRIEKTDKIIKTASQEVKNLITNPLFLTGLALYWAEGDKAQERVKFTNSDGFMISLMMKWLRRFCKVPEKQFRVSLHVHDMHVRPDLIKHWSKITAIPPKQFHKVYVKPSSLHQRRNILYNGTCAIVISSRNLFRKIMGWKKGMLDYFGISP